MALSRTDQYNHDLWFAKRDEILKRDNNTCQICGSKLHVLEVHHLCYFPGLLVWEYDNELLITACKTHHTQLTYDIPKLSGLIAVEFLKQGFDLVSMYEIIKQHGQNKNNKT